MRPARFTWRAWAGPSALLYEFGNGLDIISKLPRIVPTQYYLRLVSHHYGHLQGL